MRPLRELFQAGDYPDLLVGLGAPDDAAVWRLEGGRSLVVTTDFFTPVVDDPFDYGSIAAANALSDLYAMGARPFMALNVAAMPPDLPVEVVREIFRGGAEKVREAGAVLAGGHTVQDKEPKYGLVGLGFAETDRLMTKAAAHPGDILAVTKPLGFGVITTALKAGKAREQDVAEAVGWMVRLNGEACDLAVEVGVRAATDVTGFSLLGHATEMAQASGVGLTLHLPAIPFIPSARGYAEQGHFPGGSADNRLYFGPNVEFDPGVDEYNQMLLFDAQTSGGLLLGIPPEAWGTYVTGARQSRIPVWPIGEVRAGEGIRVLASAPGRDWGGAPSRGKAVAFWPAPSE